MRLFVSAFALFWCLAAHAMGSAPAAPSPCLDTANLLRPNPLQIHSHNDYDEQKRPLWDALASRIPSVEADVWYAGFEYKLSHDGFFYVGTLDGLYLDPLQKILQQQSSVLGDEKTFYLWMDIKVIDPDHVPGLIDLMRSYPMLTHPRRTALGELPLQVILTGDETVKTRVARELNLETVIRDSNDWSESDATVDPYWQWYALSWDSYLDWDGTGTIPAEEKAKLRHLVESVHGLGRKVRFWDNPETAPYWTALEESGADMIGAHGLPAIHEYFDRCLPPN